MAEVVEWTDEAIADVEEIAEYIARSSPANAKRVVAAIRAAALSLPAFPRLNRIVPEFQDPAARGITDAHRQRAHIRTCRTPKTVADAYAAHEALRRASLSEETSMAESTAIEAGTDASAPSAKDQVRALLDRLPDDLTLEQIQYHLGVYVKITRSEERADREGWVPHEEVKRRIDGWFAK